MKAISLLLTAIAILALFTGCANQGEPPRVSTTLGAEGDFNSNNAMLSAW